MEYPACWTWPIPTERPATIKAAFAWQEGRCAICGDGPEFRTRSMVEDHDHATGLLRGKLCRSCNVMEGRAALNDPLFERYWLVNPASVFGVEEPYVDMFGRVAKPDPWPTPEEFIASLPAATWTRRL